MHAFEDHIPHLTCLTYLTYTSLIITCLTSLTQVTPAPEDVYPSKDTTKVLDNAAKHMKDRKDSYLAVDSLILAGMSMSLII